MENKKKPRNCLRDRKSREARGSSEWEEKKLEMGNRGDPHHTSFPKPVSQPAATLDGSPVQFNSIAQSCPTLCHPMNFSTPGLPVHHQLPESIQTPVHRICDAIQPSYPLSSPSPPAFNLSQHQGLFQGVSSSHQVAKVLKFQFQHQSF